MRISTKHLKDALLALKKNAGTKSNLDTLDCVRFERGDRGQWTAETTNLDNWLRVDLSALPVPEGGPESTYKFAETIVDVKNLYSLVRKLKKAEDSVVLDITDDGDLRLEGGRGEYTVQQHAPVSEFPINPSEDFDGAGLGREGIDVEELTESIEKVLPSIATDDARANLTGAYFQYYDEELIVSTDGHRLRATPQPSKGLGFGYEGNSNGIIVNGSGLTLAEYIGRVRTFSDEVNFREHEGHVEFDFGDYRLTAQKIEGTFPDFSQVLPERSEASFETSVESDDALDSIAAVLPVASELPSNSSLILFDGETGRVKIRSKDAEEGLEAEARLAPEFQNRTDDEKTATYCLNLGYFEDALESFPDANRLHLQAYGSMSPIIIENPETEWTDLAVVMPMRK